MTVGGIFGVLIFFVFFMFSISMFMSGSILFGLVFLLVGIFLAWLISGLVVIKEWERIVILRLGRFTEVRGPGITYYFPGMERVANRVDLRTRTYHFSAEKTLTRDNIPVDVDAVVFFRVFSSKEATLNVENYSRAAELASQTSLREVIGQRELDELLSNREAISEHVQEIIDEKTERWGVKVEGVEIRDITVPSELQDEIMSQARAERERRARVIHATAEVQAADKMIEAAQKYGRNEMAFRLRWLNILHEIGREQNTTMLIPTSFPVKLESSESLAKLMQETKKNKE
ncbi:MAG: slipin family protein [Candidatus Korarchaeota archaeon]|nr:slipin family protein [Candidatus Korarchaeota archaeon]NIU85402.1 slipin family protein [Candidatus Thorarchaeota archaeon]NIW15499.1 slipin family protein [Candidatus Thorarchaeota archaeon]NIW53444.1 slipin family protein [Candidatus Korarchaeota archaeon]